MLLSQSSKDLKVILLSTIFLKEIPDLLNEQYPIIEDLCHRRNASGGRFLCTLERLFHPRSLAKRTQAQRDVLASVALLTASIVAYDVQSSEPLPRESRSDPARSFEACRSHLTAALSHYAATMRKGCGQEGEEVGWTHAGLWVVAFRGVTLHAWK